MSGEDISNSTLAEAEHSTVPGNLSAIFPEQASNIIQFPVTAIDFKAYHQFEFPQGAVIPLNGFPALYLSALIPTTIDAPILDETVKELLKKPGEEIEKEKLQARLLKTRYDLHDKLAAYEIPYSVAECLVEVETGKFKSATYLREDVKNDAMRDDATYDQQETEKHLPLDKPDFAPEVDTRHPQTISTRLREMAEAEKYTLSEVAALLYPNVPIKIARSRMSIHLTNLRQKIEKDGSYIPDGRYVKGGIFRIVSLEKPDTSQIEDVSNSPAGVQTDSANGGEAKDAVNNDDSLLRGREIPDTLDTEDFFIGKAVDKTNSDKRGATESGLQDLTAGEAAMINPTDGMRQPVDIKEPEKPGYYRLRKRDARQITSYRPETYTLSVHDKRTLGGILEKGAITIPIEERRRLNIDKLNSIVLLGTGLSIRVMPIGDFSQASVLLVKSGKMDDKVTAGRIAARLRYMEYRSQHPPFSASYEPVDAGLKVWLEGPNKKSTTPWAVNHRMYDMYGAPIAINKPSEYRSMEKSSPGQFVITAQEQYRLVNALLKNPSIPVGKLSSFFTDNGSRNEKPRNEMGILLKLTDKLFNKWGLAVEIDKDPNDPNAVTLCKLVTYDSNHKAPQLGFVLVDVAAEEAALPQRQRRRQPSHAKLRI